MKPSRHNPTLIDYDEGNEEETRKVFQHLVNTGQAWHLEGSVGRMANAMLDSGFIKKPKKQGGKDAYGNNLKSYYDKKK